jgi:hypothetical protein
VSRADLHKHAAGRERPERVAHAVGVDGRRRHRKRLHSSLGYVSPEEFEEQFMERQAA